MYWYGIIFFPHCFPSLCFPCPSLACRTSLAFVALRFVIFFLVFHVSALHRRCCPSFYSSSFFVSLCRTARSDLLASRLCQVSPSFVYYVDIVFRSMHYRPVSFPYAIRFPHSTVSPLVLPVDDPFDRRCAHYDCTSLLQSTAFSSFQIYCLCRSCSCSSSHLIV